MIIMLRNNKEKDGDRISVVHDRTLFLEWPTKNGKKNNTRDSNVVPHRSTNRARRCLTSLSRREAVLSSWYGRSYQIGYAVKHNPYYGDGVSGAFSLLVVAPVIGSLLSQSFQRKKDLKSVDLLYFRCDNKVN